MPQFDSSSPAHIDFSYESVSIEQRRQLYQAAREIRANIDISVRSIWNIGRELVSVRSQLEDNVFGDWLHGEFEWSRSTAYNYIRIYEAFPSLLSDPYQGLNIDPSALYKLAAPSTPAELKSHFIALARSGEYISHKEVKVEIDRVKRLPTITETQLVPEPNIEILDWEEDEELTTTQPAVSALKPSWNRVNENFLLFWGDITSARFRDRLPSDAYVFVASCNPKQKAWLLEDKHNSIALTDSQLLDSEIVASFLAVIAQGHQVIVFPWLPKPQIVKIAMDLQLKVYIADPNLQRCEWLLSQLGFDLQQIRRIWT
jgi:hypothetical protein